MRASRGWVWIERLLVVIGVVCLGWWTIATVHAWSFRSQQISAFEHLTTPENPATPPAPAVMSPLRKVSRHESPGPDGLVGILDVPRLGISTPVIAGDDERALDVAAGHLRDTPFPWEPGNSTVAAHRDGLFRPLRGVRRGDLIRIRTVHGDFEYTVRDMKVVEPDDLSVLANGRTDSLTLITCYPFAFIGHAPQRFIVRAEREQAGPPPGVSLVAARESTAATVVVASAPALKKTRAVAKAKPAKSVKKTRASARDGHKRTTVSSQARKTTALKPAEQKDDRPKKKRRWYRLFLG